MYDIIMSRQTILSIYLYALRIRLILLIARDNVEGKYNTVHQYSISTATT